MLPLASVVICCALLQSVFGVGILIFGVPALLFLGYSFSGALFHLLPCSILISSLQLRDDFAEIRGMARLYLACLVPSCAAGAAFVFWSESRIQIRLAVGVMLLASAALRMSPRLRGALAGRLSRILPAALAVIGAIHGMTSMGGGLLAALMNVLHVEKHAVRANIAIVYWIMGTIQFGLLLWLKGPQGSFGSVFLLMALTLSAYLLLGRRAFHRSPALVFQHAMTAILAAGGALLIVR